MAIFEISVQLAAPASQVYEFFLNPYGRPLVSPPGTGMVIVNSPNPLHVGALLEFKVQGMGMVQTMTHEIIELEPNVVMFERQVKGPLKSFSHRHRFVENGPNQMTLFDEIEFDPPGGILGLLATEDKLLENFEDGFFFRNKELGKRFGNVV